jgi:hypothetical protein
MVKIERTTIDMAVVSSNKEPIGIIYIHNSSPCKFYVHKGIFEINKTPLTSGMLDEIALWMKQYEKDHPITQ